MLLYVYTCPTKEYFSKDKKELHTFTHIFGGFKEHIESGRRFNSLSISQNIHSTDKVPFAYAVISI